jgi:hypothetical protein
LIQRGVLAAFNASTYVATVQFAGSLSAVVAGVAVSRAIASGEMVVGRRVAVALFDVGNPADSMVVGVY